MEKEIHLFEEYYKSARDLILERFSSPFIFSFVISWLISNYKILMVVLTDQTDYFMLEYKLWLINEYLNWSNGFVYPFVAACLYTFIYPFFDKKISEFTLKRKLEKRNAIHAIEKTQLRTVEEVEAIHRRHFSTESELRQEINNARIVEEQLRAKIADLEKTNKNKPEEPSLSTPPDTVKKASRARPSSPPYKPTQDDLLAISMLGKALDSGLTVVEEKDILRLTKLSLSKLKLTLSRLSNNDYIFHLANGYELKPKGLEAYNALIEANEQLKK